MNERVLTKVIKSRKFFFSFSIQYVALKMMKKSEHKAAHRGKNEDEISNPESGKKIVIFCLFVEWPNTGD